MARECLRRGKVAGKRRSDRRERGVEEIRAGVAGAASRSKKLWKFPRGEGLQVLCSKDYPRQNYKFDCPFAKI
jgi:hypothetical protein